MQISCPQCGKLLESPFPLPERAQCPFCAAIFTPVPPGAAAPVQPPPPPLLAQSTSPFAPPAAFGTADAGPGAIEQVQKPAIGLLIGGILSLLWVLLDLVFCVVFLMGFQQGPPQPNLP